MRLGVTAARAPYAARVHLSAVGPFAEVVALGGLIARLAVGHHPWQFRHFGNPATVRFLFNFDCVHGFILA